MKLKRSVEYISESKEMNDVILEGVKAIFNKFITSQYGNISNERREMTYSFKTLWLDEPIRMRHFGSAADDGTSEGICKGVQWFGKDKVVTWFECPESGDITHHYELLSDEQFYGHPLCIDGSKLPKIHNI